MPRLGVVGTMVWDTIHARDSGRESPVEEWGGIAYALAGIEAALDETWDVFPILKVGRDMRPEADAFLAGLGRVESLDGVRTVPEPNNRVELFYHDTSRRCERLTGGVPAWAAEEIVPLARSCDALYVNFIAGWELDLVAAIALRGVVRGPIYCDIHSLLLGVGPDGVRQLRPLDDWRAWLRAFDIVQLNEDELETLADGWEDPWALAAEVLGPATRALLVTLGGRGAAWVSTREFWEDPLRPGDAGHGLAPAGALLSGKVSIDDPIEDADPTGCGDVWGATCFAALLGGADLERAMRVANRAAGRNAGFRGAGGLAEYLGSTSGLLTQPQDLGRGGPA